MSRSFVLADSQTLDDLQVFLARAARIEEGSVRLIAGSGVLAVYVAVFYPVGLLDESPTVLGLRTVALAPGEDGAASAFDAVVPIRSLLTRIEGAQRSGVTTVALPMEVNTVTWAAISPPRGGWQAGRPTTSGVLDAAARAGIDEVAAALPSGAGEQIVRRVRSEVWSRPIAGLEHVPAGAGFAALGLGFLGDDEVRVYETGPWTRLTMQRGHVLIKRKAWTLSR
ncbi:MAG TPA: hypothetical protein VL294_08095 [Pseudolysinimonas sp.]|jgi:hypothetical protein|nr:hypothetical protein [Pseudolysinimonas sp.]